MSVRAAVNELLAVLGSANVDSEASEVLCEVLNSWNEHSEEQDLAVTLQSTCPVFSELPAEAQYKLTKSLLNKAGVTVGPSHSTLGGGGCESWDRGAAENFSSEPLKTITEIFPNVSREFLEYSLQRELGDVEATIIWLTGQTDIEKEAQRWQTSKNAVEQKRVEEEKNEQKMRKQLVDRFLFQPESLSKQSRGSSLCVAGHGGSGAIDRQSASKVRYRNGVPVASKGEKFIVEQVGEEWNGGSTGKVYTKGKRGKGVS